MKLRIYENVTLGDVLAGSLDRDKTDFADYAPRFDAGYQADHKLAIKAVKFMDQVVVKTGQNKLYTMALYQKADSLQIPVRKLEGYVVHAGKLNLLDTPVENFGIHEVRMDMHRKDLEGLGEHLEGMNQNIDHNKAVLLNEGLKQLDIDALIDLKLKIDEQNAQQELNKEDRNILSKSDEQLVAELKAFNDDILDVGKRIFKGVNDAKYNDYVLVRLMKQLRNEGNSTQKELDEIEKSGALSLKCLDANGNPVIGITGKVVGKDDEAESDEEGVLYFESITIEDGELISVEITGEIILPKTVSDIELILGGEFEMEVMLDAEPTEPV